ncbi:conserved hypothetical protein [Planktothrix sp. PCC 11201]|uniref:Uncharacterized protein n=1 Tax=Planktothrix serta PCC 8927 TaxID=671068 RepID=A0A7Z9BN64_9CYAN|nr:MULTISPECIES: hypothetical protein [Planktothrix]SKB14234.1 conserved hypothetical protein [Planktothrix sp. PCC 11201]VXD14926.1 conserved hypothetical protein [Planktothrix serta PCC 8927]
MAKLPPERRAIIWDFKQRLLDIVDEAKATELDLLERFGETESTLGALEQLTEIAEQAKQRFSQLSILQMRIAESQPRATPDLLTLLDDRIVSISSRVPALERSTQEIKADWNLL